MNNRGMAIGTKVILVIILLLIVFIAVAGSFGFGFKKVFDQAKQLLGFPSAQLEELRNITTPSEVEKIKEAGERDVAVQMKRYKGFASVNEILLDASNYISGRNEKRTIKYPLKNGSEVQFVIGGNNNAGIPNYEKAVEKYLEYYKTCGDPPKHDYCTMVKKAIIFRILNALKEKFFTLIVDDKGREAANLYNSFIGEPTKLQHYLISEKQFKSHILPVFIAAYTKKGDFNNLKLYKEKWGGYRETQPSVEKIYHSYITGIIDYYSIIKECSKDESTRESCIEEGISTKISCELAIRYILEYRSSINPILKPFEYKDPSKPILQASDYRFLNEPYKDIEDICKL